MKIAIFSDTFPPKIDGVANVAYQSAKNLSNLGHQVTVFTVSSNIRTRKDKSLFKDDNFELIKIPSVKSFSYTGDYFALPTGISFKYLRKNRPDIIHTHTPFPIGWAAIFAAKTLKIPIVGTHHTFYNHYLKYLKMDNKVGENFIWKYTVQYYNNCDKVLSPSQFLADEMVRYGLKRPISTLSNPIDVNQFKPADNISLKEEIKKSFGLSKKSLVYMGRLGYEKSVDKVIESAAICIKKNPEIKLLVVGDGPERTKLNDLVKRLNVKQNVIFTGFLTGKRLIESLQASDVFLTASKTENMPLSILEAMAVGLPIIGADALGIPEIIEDGKNGFLVAPDDTEQMAEKTLKILSSEQIQSDFSKASQTLSLNYSDDTITKKLEGVYKELISKTNEDLLIS